MLGASFISTIIGTKLPGDGALWFSQNFEFILPIRVGDTISIYAEVVSKDERNKVIELKTVIKNQYGQKVTKGFAKVKIAEQEEILITKTTDKSIIKTALVIGGSGGIGSAVSLALAEEGFKVAIHYHKNKVTAKNLTEKIEIQGGKAYSYSCDITDYMSVSEMIESIRRRFGVISVLVNCSTLNTTPMNFSELNWKSFESHLNNQILGAYNLVRAVLPNMENAGYGKIIHLDSKVVDQPYLNLLPYTTAKGALRAFSKALAYDLAPKGICVNMVSPGITETELIANLSDRTLLVEAAKTPLKRLAKPKDVANAVVFLSSEKSDYLCGEIIRVNGGQLMM